MKRKRNEWVRNMLVVNDIGEVMQQNRLRWFGHIILRGEMSCVG